MEKERTFDKMPLTSLLKDVTDAEKRFLRGRESREEDLQTAIHIFLEILRGFESLDFDAPCVTVFGSARFPEDHRYYKMARSLGQRLAEEGYVVMTGGGPGIMEAANRGAKEAGGLSIGSNIRLPHEQGANPYLDYFVEFEYFFVRKVMLVKYSTAFVVLPGGFGTMDELFETLTLIQTKKIEQFPIVAMGTDYWDGMRDVMRDTLLREQTISPEDVDLMQVTDDVAEAVRFIGEKRKEG